MVLHFIINPGSGKDDLDLTALIRQYFAGSAHEIHIYELHENCNKKDIEAEINRIDADRVVAAGGDGTLKLVAECLLRSKKPMGIIPAGSANGMAKELGIPTDPEAALAIAVTGVPTFIHAIKINDELCIHLADLGFNAYIVKKFDSLSHRGMLGYAKAAWHALWNHRKMEVELDMGDELVRSAAAMVVVANATMYGTGVKINPIGRLDDDVFEVVLVKTYSVLEVLKMRFTRKGFNPKKVEFFQTRSLQIKSKHNAHFQVDGEYMGKIRGVSAKILPAAICMVLPPETKPDADQA
ncbi:diacylglycerol kinase family protein [Pedobacter sp. SYP-B3415]|uniref:diacylglycerol/lipid kinase family protein n=1 Tax=Pedobacter sp. SYP-B3415 TaxID=2496641 RepID=UPI00101BE2FF|nr:diacylglycerol kinase family protein [Pedobacter sp. SYP-B3415]